MRRPIVIFGLRCCLYADLRIIWENFVTKRGIRNPNIKKDKIINIFMSSYFEDIKIKMFAI